MNMTLNRAHEIPGAVLVAHGVYKAQCTVAAMQTMLDQKKAEKAEKSAAASFATKCGKASVFSNKTTITDLLEEKTIEHLEIHTAGTNHWLGLYDHDLGEKGLLPLALELSHRIPELRWTGRMGDG